MADIIKLREKSAIIISVLILAISASLQLLPQDAQLLMRLDRTELANLELWRLLSGHLVHLSWNHLLLNAAGLVLLALLFDSSWHSRDIVLGGVFSALAISLGIYFLFPDIMWYVGLSGVIHAWFVIASIRVYTTQPRFASLLLLALIAKLVFENVTTGNTDADWLGGNVIEQQHLLGASSGLFYALLSKTLSVRLPKHT